MKIGKRVLLKEVYLHIRNIWITDKKGLINNWQKDASSLRVIVFFQKGFYI